MEHPTSALAERLAPYLDDGEGVVIQNGAASRVAAFVRTLEPVQRNCFVMMARKASPAETARLLEIPEARVHEELRAAKAKVEAFVRRLGDEPPKSQRVLPPRRPQLGSNLPGPGPMPKQHRWHPQASSSRVPVRQYPTQEKEPMVVAAEVIPTSDWLEDTLREAYARRAQAQGRIDALTAELEAARASLPQLDGVILALGGEVFTAEVDAPAPPAEVPVEVPAPPAAPEPLPEPESEPAPESGPGPGPGPEPEPVIAEPVVPPVRTAPTQGAELAKQKGRENIDRVRDAVRDAGPGGIRLGELKTRTKLSQTVVSRHLRALIKSGGVIAKRDGGRGALYAAVYDTPAESAPPTPAPPDEAEQATRESLPTPTAPATPMAPASLMGMPAAANGLTSGGLQRQAAERQLKVYEALANTDLTTRELADATGFPVSRIGDYVRSLGEARLVFLTGEQRSNAPVITRRNGIPYGPPTGALARMPISSSDAPLLVKLVVAALQLRVVKAAAGIGPFVVPTEFEARFPDVPRPRLTDAVNALAEANIGLRRTGNLRRAKGQTAGRTAVEFVSIPVSFDLDDVVGGTEGAAPAPLVEAPAPPAERPKLTIVPETPEVRSAIRDWVCRQTKPFNPSQMLAALKDEHGVDEDLIRASLVSLLEREIVEYVGMDDLELYAYRKPSSGDEGAAARIDRQRRPAEPSGRSGGGPIAGTGKGLTVSDPDVRALVRDAEAAGATVTHGANGHFVVVTPEGRRAVISATPRNPRSVMNDRSRLRRNGLAV